MNNQNNLNNVQNILTSEEIVQNFATALEASQSEVQRLRSLLASQTATSAVPTSTDESTPGIPMPTGIPAVVFPTKVKKESLPTRTRIKPTKKIQKKLHFNGLSQKKVQQSQFWNEILKQNYDLILTPTDLEELQLDICKGAKTINYDGYWYVETAKNTKFSTKKKTKTDALACFFDSACDYFFVAGSQINYVNGRRNGYIKHNKQYDDTYNVVDCTIKGLDTDSITWVNRFSGEKILWKRYSPVLCVWDLFGESLDEPIYGLIQEFVGNKVFIKKSVAKEKTFAMRVVWDEKTERAVQCHLRCLKITQPSDFNILRKVIWTMDESILGRINPGILADICPGSHELDLLRKVQNQNKDKHSHKQSMVEAFFDSVKDIPLLKQRLNDWQFKLNFNGDCSFVEENVNKLHKVLQVLQNSENFKAFIGIFLSIYNFTTGKRNKYTYGFEICSGNYYGHKCVMEFIVRFCQDKYPYVLDWVKEFDVLDHAAVDLFSRYNDIITSYLHLTRKVTSVEQRLSNYQAGGCEYTDGYIQLLQPFIHAAKLRLRILSDSMARLEKGCSEFDDDVFGNGSFSITASKGYGMQGFDSIYQLKIKTRSNINAVNNRRIHENKKFKLYQMKAELRELRKHNRMNKKANEFKETEEEVFKKQLQPKLRSFPTAKDKVFFDEDVLFDWQETRNKILSKTKDNSTKNKTKTVWRCVVVDDDDSTSSGEKNKCQQR